MSSSFIDMTGKKCDKLTVISRSDRKDYDGRYYWKCLCECGNEKEVNGRTLRNKFPIDCGCVWKEILTKQKTTHGQTNTCLYRTWASIKNRCYNVNGQDYPDYGGRGIYVCNTWRYSFEQFAKDMGPHPEGLSIERVDNDGPYSPENCKWGTDAEQAKNTRRNHWIEFDGKRLILQDWARHVGISVKSLRDRIKRWGIERSLSTIGPQRRGPDVASRSLRCSAS